MGFCVNKISVVRKNYIKPNIEIIEYVVERGFVASATIEDDWLLGDVSDGNENVGEGSKFTLFDNDPWN